jgi:hypothetical protein
LADEASQANDRLRAFAATQGVQLRDEDLDGLRGFLDVFLPALAELPALLPPDAAPAPLPLDPE